MNEQRQQVTKQNKTKQNKTKQNETKRNKAKQSKAKQNKAKQNKTKQNKTKQNKNQLITRKRGRVVLLLNDIKPVRRAGSVAEWSKALVLGTSHFDGVGSNPTAATPLSFVKSH